MDSWLSYTTDDDANGASDAVADVADVELAQLASSPSSDVTPADELASRP